MKKLILFLSMVGIFSGCERSVTVETVNGYAPVYGTLEDLRASIVSTSPQPLTTPGKIYVKGNLLFINEVLKGVHVFDNSDASNPVALAFINIPGNIDVAMSGNYLYADFSNGLATMNVSDYQNVVLESFNTDYQSRENGQIVPPSALGGHSLDNKVYFECVDETKGLVINWISKEVPTSSCYTNR